MNIPSRPSGSAAPTPAGIYDYLLGGRHHSTADREAAEKALAIAPEARFAARENRAFLQRVVRYIAGQGVRQYIDIGSGFPTVGPVHEIATEVVPDPHVIYVDYDPAVTALSRELLKSPNAVTIARDLRYPWDIIEDPEVTRLIDWSQPVAVLMVAILHFIAFSDHRRSPAACELGVHVPYMFAMSAPSEPPVPASRRQKINEEEVGGPPAPYVRFLWSRGRRGELREPGRLTSPRRSGTEARRTSGTALGPVGKIPDAEDPAEIITTFRDLMAPGSYLVISHASHGENPDAAEKASHAWDSARSGMTLRTPHDIDGLFVGFDLVPPGLVTTTEWGTASPAPTGQGLILAGVGRVP